MTFAYPYALALLLALPPLAILLGRRQRQLAAGFTAAAIWHRVGASARVKAHRLLPVVRLTVLGVLVIALARPQVSVDSLEQARRGIAIAMIIDISTSMAAIDFQTGDDGRNRLDVVKATFRNFVAGTGDELKGRQGDMIGLVSFARFADGLAPPTPDTKALVKLLDDVKIVPFPEEDGTAIGDAIIAGVDLLRPLQGASKVMILLTDGSSNAGQITPVRAAQIAKSLGVRIYTIGAGSAGMVMMPRQRDDGTVELTASQFFIDEATLTRVADLTGGRFFRADNAKGLAAIYGEIDRLEKAEFVAERRQRKLDVYAVFLAAALLLFVAEVLMARLWLRTAP